MSEKMTLVLAEDERAAIAEVLRHYGKYRESVGAQLWNSFVFLDLGEPEPPGIAPQVEEMTGFHLTVAEECESLAVAFQGDKPVSLTRRAIDLIEEALDEAYVDGFPPEVARTAMFCRIAYRRITEADPGTVGEFVVANARTQPPATEGVAASMLLDVLTEVGANNVGLRKQIAEQTRRVTALGIRMKAQLDEIERLHGRDRTRSRRMTKQFNAFGVVNSSPRPTQRGIDL